MSSSAVTPASDYDPDQSLDTRQFLPRLAVSVAKQVERKLPHVTRPEMNTHRIRCMT